MDISESDWAWACGLYEGEGTVFNSGRAITVALHMTDYEPVAEFHRIVGVGKLYGPYDNGPGRKPFLRWSVNTKREAVMLFEKFKPRLSPRRVHQFETAIAKAPETRVPKYVSQNKRTGKWIAYAPGSTVKIHLGSFPDEKRALEAVARYVAGDIY